ncbi:hypothetical protein K474DRAFT_1586402 [Panus rudis PR-1116 ss-1]|nr:hypothetical protein K474DRAFT_1586402 [Panus rudis PR-1116 ss-1]
MRLAAQKLRFSPTVFCAKTCKRPYATVGSTTFVGKPPIPPPINKADIPAPPLSSATDLNRLILSSLSDKNTPLPSLVEQYEQRSGSVLSNLSLPYESRPSSSRRADFEQHGSDLDNNVVMIAHAIQHGIDHKVAVCSGFAIRATHNDPEASPETMILTCAHTLEEVRPMRHSPMMSAASKNAGKDSKSGSFVISGTPKAPSFHAISSVQSALHRADVLLLSPADSSLMIRTLPISPYPAHPGTPIRAHFVTDKKPNEEGWRPWVGGTWSKWVKGTVVGYRDFAGREAKPGTYDALSHMLFKPLPTPGSSGGPIIDEESGAVVGMVVGTRMDSSIEGMRGWAVPAETIFEMFSLPGLRLKGQ